MQTVSWISVEPLIHNPDIVGFEWPHLEDNFIEFFLDSVLLTSQEIDLPERDMDADRFRPVLKQLKSVIS